MCPISSSPFLSAFNFHSLQVTGVSCNMLCFPTWVLMRQMNIHEEEADIAVWRLCSGWLCAWGLLWPHFWGICCAVGRHQGTLGSFANDADAGVLFWSVVVDDLFPRPFLSPSWLLELKFSLQLLVEDSQGVNDWEKELPFYCLHSSYSSSLWSWLLTKGCHESPLQGPSLSSYFTSHYLLLPFLSFVGFFAFSFHGDKNWFHHMLKDILETMWPVLTAKGCVVHACHVSWIAVSSCALPTPFFPLLWALFCSSVSPRTVPIVISHVFFPSFPFFCMTDSHLHFLTSSSSSLPLLSPLPSAWGFLWSPFHLLFAVATFSPLSLNLSSFISLQDIWPSHILNLLISTQSFSTWSDVCLCLQPKVEICVCLSGTCFVLSTL